MIVQLHPPDPASLFVVGVAALVGVADEGRTGDSSVVIVNGLLPFVLPFAVDVMAVLAMGKVALSSLVGLMGMFVPTTVCALGELMSKGGI